MAELYQSQEAVIIERAKERGIDLKQLQDYFEVKIAEISATYPDPTYSYIWRLAKVERYVWDRFFPTDAFPGLLLYGPGPTREQAPKAQEKNYLNLPWSHDRFNPNAQPSPIHDSYLARPEEARVWPNDKFEDSRDYIRPGDDRNEGLKMNRQVGDHYSPPRTQSSRLNGQTGAPVNGNSTSSAASARIAPQGPNALQRLTPSEIADRDAEYPTPVTFTEKLMEAGEFVANPTLLSDNSPQPPQALGPVRQVITKSVIDVHPAQHRGGSQERSRPTDFGETYVVMEREMELRAIKGNFRRDMFVYLGNARSSVREKHPHCSRHIRSYLADKKTWTHFWRGEPFPRNPPRDGHVLSCVNRYGLQENAVVSQSIFDQYPKNAPVLPALKNRSIFDQPLTNSAARTLIPSSIYQEPYIPATRLFQQPSAKSIIATKASCVAPKRGRLSPVFSAAFDNSPFAKVVEPTTISVKVEDTNMSGVAVSVARPDANTTMHDAMATSGDSEVPASIFTLRPIAKAIPKLSHGSIISQANHRLSIHQPDNAGSATTPMPQAVVFTSPDELWNRFKASFKATDAERPRMEKNVKEQKGMRMVYDEQSKQMVTVNELIKRTQYRYALNSKLKRKTEDFEQVRDAKRAATSFLDNFASEPA